MAGRLDVRLDAERRRRLEEIVRERGEPISEVVRCLIDDAYDGVIQERRKLAVQRLVEMEVEDPAAFIDANVPIYASGREHPNKEPCAQILTMVAERPLSFVTDVEVLQELLHRYLALRRWILGGRVLRAFAEVMQDRIEPVYEDDIHVAGSLADSHPEVSARDLVHTAVMQRLGVD